MSEARLEAHHIDAPEGNGVRLATLALPGRSPTLVWLGGFRSDMRGGKAERLHRFAEREGLACLRLDYSGHGESGGRFEDGTISRWTADAFAAIERCTSGPLLLVGSSMGAWIALRLVERFRRCGEGARVRGLLLLAPAPDFVTRLLEPSFSEEERRALARNGRVERASAYAPEPTVYTRALIEDGREAAVMTGPIETGCPVRILQGMADPDVPHTHALDLVEHLPADGVVLTLVSDGDHRLSREEDLQRMEAALRELLEEIGDDASAA